MKEIVLKQVMTNQLPELSLGFPCVYNNHPRALNTHRSLKVWYCTVVQAEQILLGGAHKNARNINAIGRWLPAGGKAS